MSIPISPRKFFTLALAITGLCALAQADSFSSVVVYGDSLSDNGNIFALSGGTVPSPVYYFDGRRSNGPVAVEQLAIALGVPLVDLALLGATTGIGNIGDNGTPTSVGGLGLPGMQAELAGTPLALLSTGLVVVWGGADDILSPSPLDTTLAEIASRAAGDIDGIVATLQGLGAQHILVPGIPDLGATPYFAGLGPFYAAEATEYSNLFNADLIAGLPAGAIYYDTARLFQAIIANPGAYGLSNVTQPCYDEVVTVCADPSQYLFYDSFHPTTAADAIAARAFENAVPEPSSIVLLLTACAFGIGSRKRLFASR